MDISAQSKSLAAAFVAAVSHQFSGQYGARLHRHGAVSALCHAGEIEHRWPRRFKFQLELFVEDGATAKDIDQAYREHSPGEDAECVVDLLVADPAPIRADTAQYGFVPAFQKALLAFAIKPPVTVSAKTDGLRISRVDTPEQIAQTAVFGPDHRSDPGLLADGYIRDFLA